MINEILFCMHVVLVASLCLLTLKLGKHALISFICLLSVLSNLFVTKQMMLFGFHVTCSEVFAVGGIFGLNLLQEFHGKENAKKAIITSFCISFIYLIMSQIHLLYQPSSVDAMHGHFVEILGLMPRIISASIASYLIVQLFDTYFYALLKTLSKGKMLVMRNIVSLACSQLLDTVLFTFLALYGIVGSVWEVIVMSYAIKLIVIAGTAPFIAGAKKLNLHAHQ